MLKLPIIFMSISTSHYLKLNLELLFQDVPSKGENLKDCKLFECSTCCTEKVTSELAKVPLGYVGKIDYAQCGGLTDA